MKILLISSDTTYIKEMENDLKQKGYDIKQVSYNTDVFAQTDVQQADITVIDNRANHAETLALCRQVRETHKARYAYIILVVDQEKALRMAAFEAGADAVLKTPGKSEDLEVLIKAGERVVTSLAHGSEREKAAKQDENAHKKTIKTDSDKERNTSKVEFSELVKKDRVSAKIALLNKLVAKDQLMQAISIIQGKEISEEAFTLAETLHEKGMITSEVMNNLISATKRRMGKRFGHIAVEKGITSREMVDKAMQIQAGEFKTTHSCRRIGDIMVDLGAITKQERDSIWREQEDYETIDD